MTASVPAPRTARRPAILRAVPARAAVLLLASALLAALLTGCGGDAGGAAAQPTNGVGELKPETIERRARLAAEQASTVRLSGNVITDGRTYRLDMRLGQDGGVGEVSTDGMTFELLRVGGDLYIKAGGDFWESQRDAMDEDVAAELDSDPTEKLEGKYVKVAAQDPVYEQLSGFTDKSLLLEALLSLEGTRERGEPGEIAGVPTVRVQAAGGTGGAMEVSLDGTPYPLRMERGGEAGQVTLDDWNQKFSLHPPKEDQIVDYGDKIIEADG